MSKKKQTIEESNAFYEGCIASAETEVDTETEAEWLDEEFTLPTDDCQYSVENFEDSSLDSAASEFEWPDEDSDATAASEFEWPDDSFEDTAATEYTFEKSEDSFIEGIDDINDDCTSEEAASFYSDEDFCPHRYRASSCRPGCEAKMNCGNTSNCRCLFNCPDAETDAASQDFFAGNFEPFKTAFSLGPTRGTIIVELARLGQVCHTSKQLDSVLDLLWMGANGNFD